MKARSDTSVVLIFCLAVVAWQLISETIVRARQQKLGYICAGQGETLIDNNAGGPAKCWNPKSTLMHEPEELLLKR